MSKYYRSSMTAGSKKSMRRQGTSTPKPFPVVQRTPNTQIRRHLGELRAGRVRVTGPVK